MGISVVVDRALADVTARNAKGIYTHEDLNRVGEAVNIISGLFNDNGYANSVVGRTDWTADDTPDVSDMSSYLQNITELKAIIGAKTDTPDTPSTMAFLDYIKANHIEQILLDIDAIVEGMIAEYRPLGMFWLGLNNGII